MARNGKKKTKKQKSLPFIEPDAAGIDIGATEIYVAVPEERDIRPVRKFATFTEDLHALADWLIACQIKTVAMESTGVYWIALFQILESRGLEVSTPAISKGCRVAKPTSRIASGCNTSTVWDCSEDLFGLRKPFVPFAVSCATATTSSRAPRAKCCSCKKPSPR
jgi:hypothetical protein